MATAPCGTGMCERYHVFRFSESNIFRPRLKTQISLNPLKKLAFARKRFGAVEGRTSELNRCEWIKLICPSPGKIRRPVRRGAAVAPLPTYRQEARRPSKDR
jgi:hypothetical protein